MAGKTLLERLAQLEQLLELYQNQADKLTFQEHQEQVQKKLTLIANARARIKQTLQKTTASSTAELENLFENASQLSEEELTAKLQETWPDFLPTTSEIIENCYLTVFNVGMLTYEEGGTPFDTVSFTINEDKVESLTAKRNGKGTITIFSNWRYHQKNTDIGYHSFSGSTSHSIKNYKITCSFEVNEQGEVDVYKQEVLRITQEDTDVADLFFFALPIAVELDNSDRLSITGGTTVNNMSIVPQNVRDFLKKKFLGKQELTQTFSLKVAAAMEQEVTPVAPMEKELVFEKENQAVLSSDQTSVLIKWWNNINESTKMKIKRNEAYIEVTGYTSNTGSNDYNYELGKDRAIDVGKKLSGIIGENLSGESVADIRVNSFGEDTEDPRKYVRIYIAFK